MSNNVAIFINPSKAYLDDRVKSTYTEWGFSYIDMIRVTEWYNDVAFQSSLFQKRFVLLDITNNNDFQKFKKIFDTDKKKEYFKSNWYGDGVIIIATNNKGTWLNKIADFADGYIERPLKIEDVKHELTEQFHLSSDIASIIFDVIGEDFNIYTTIKSSLSQLSPDEISQLTVEDIISYLPHKKGSVPPWGLSTSIFKLNINEALDNYNRIKINTYPLVVISLLKNKFSLFYKYKQLRELKYTENQILNCVGGKNTYIFSDFRHLNVSPETIKNCIILILETENKFKGGFSFPKKDVFDYLVPELITKLIIAMKNDR